MLAKMLTGSQCSVPWETVMDRSSETAGMAYCGIAKCSGFKRSCRDIASQIQLQSPFTLQQAQTSLFVVGIKTKTLIVC